jgi:predicted XRE-type DNA-binding protein
MTSTVDSPGEAFASVWDALEDSPAEAANMRLRSELMIAVKQAVTAWNVSQATAARRLDVTQPRLNDLLRGRINNFSLDALILLAGRAGLDVQMRIGRAAA